MKNLLIILLFSFSISQVFSTYDYIGTRASAMSGAVTSGDHMESGIFHNPAQLSNKLGISFVSGYSNLYGLNFIPLTNMGIIINNYAITFEKLSVEFNGAELSDETTLGFAKGISLYEDRQSVIQMGFRLNLYNYDFGQSAGTEGNGSNGIDLEAGSAYGFDIGFQGILNKKYYLGYYLQNITSYLDASNLGQALPKTISIGLSYKPYQDLVTSLDINQLSGSLDSEIRFGIEYKLFKSLTLRTGLQSNPNRFSGGLEYGNIKLSDTSSLNLSYSFLTHHVLPITQQFSIAINF